MGLTELAEKFPKCTIAVLAVLIEVTECMGTEWLTKEDFAKTAVGFDESPKTKVTITLNDSKQGTNVRTMVAEIRRKLWQEGVSPQCNHYVTIESSSGFRDIEGNEWIVECSFRSK